MFKSSVQIDEGLEAMSTDAGATDTPEQSTKVPVVQVMDPRAAPPHRSRLPKVLPEAVEMMNLHQKLASGMRRPPRTGSLCAKPSHPAGPVWSQRQTTSGTGQAGPK